MQGNQASNIWNRTGTAADAARCFTWLEGGLPVKASKKLRKPRNPAQSILRLPSPSPSAEVKADLSCSQTSLSSAFSCVFKRSAASQPLVERFQIAEALMRMLGIVASLCGTLRLSWATLAVSNGRRLSCAIQESFYTMTLPHNTVAWYVTWYKLTDVGGQGTRRVQGCTKTVGPSSSKLCASLGSSLILPWNS